MDYTIPISNINEGKNEYSFNISKEFFEKFADYEMSDGDLNFDLVINKNPIRLECKIVIVGKVKVTCDRCLEEYFEKINYTGKIIFEFGEKTEEVTDELIRLSREEEQIDFSNYIFELIKLSLPFQKFHPNDKYGNSLCRVDMIKKLEELTNKNKEQTIDPRWEQLQKLKIKN